MKPGAKLGRAPMISFLLIMLGAPLLYILAVSFLTRGETGGVVMRFTLENYARIFHPLYLKVFWRSILIAAATCALCLAVGYPYAYFAAKLPGRARFFALCAIILPFWTSSLLRAYGILIIIRTQGLINAVLLGLHIIDEPVKLIYTFGAVLAGTVYMLLPFMILPIYNAVEKIDPALLAASRDLGAGRFRAFISITLPLSMPGAGAGLTLTFIPAIGLYFISDLLGGSRTMLLGNLITDQMGSARNLPFAAALSVVLMAGMFLFLIAFMRVEKKGGSII